jgi:hypothetical protein
LGQKVQIDAAKAAGVKQVVLVSSMGGTDPNHQLNSLGNGNILQVKQQEAGTVANNATSQLCDGCTLLLLIHHCRLQARLQDTAGCAPAGLSSAAQLGLCFQCATSVLSAVTPSK